MMVDRFWIRIGKRFCHISPLFGREYLAMSRNWLWQGIASNAAFAVLLLAVGALMAYLQLSGSDLIWPALYGLAAMALLAIVMIAFRVVKFFDGAKHTTNPGVAEIQIVEWATSLGYGIKAKQSPDAHFHRVLSLANGVQVDAVRPVQQPNQFVLQSRMVIEDDLDAISKKAIEGAWLEVRRELARACVDFKVDTAAKSFAVAVSMPINLGFTPEKFVDSIRRLESALLGGAFAIQAALGNELPVAAKKLPQPVPPRASTKPQQASRRR